MLTLILIAVILIAIVAFLLKSFFNARSDGTLNRYPTTQNSTGRESTLDGMNEGDYHSGPEGYSPNTAYPETQYGSMFDEEADWNEDERDR